MFGLWLACFGALAGAALYWKRRVRAAWSLRGAEEATIPKTFQQMVNEALAQVPTISPALAHQQMQADPNTLVLDVRDASDLASTGIIPGAVNISLGTLTYKADNEVPPEWRDPRLANRARPIITTCETGEMGALAGRLLKEMGFPNVRILKGGTAAWKDAGYPTNDP